MTGLSFLGSTWNKRSPASVGPIVDSIVYFGGAFHSWIFKK